MENNILSKHVDVDMRVLDLGPLTKMINYALAAAKNPKVGKFL